MSDNYRGITLSPVISKLIESVLMNTFSQYLSTDNLQFASKVTLVVVMQFSP